MKKLLLTAAIIASSLTTFAGGTICTATTKAGQPCKAYAKKGTTLCAAHTAHAFTCGATTKAGTPCKHGVTAAGAKCFQHSK